VTRRGVPEAPIRYREDTGWEYRCESCVDKHQACFWPLVDEFWDRKRGMQRCRACFREADRARARRYYLENSTAKERKALHERHYRKANPAKMRMVEKVKWAMLKADPERYERQKELSKLRQRSYRARQKAAREMAKAA
jgi:hypothetical protein